MMNGSRTALSTLLPTLTTTRLERIMADDSYRAEQWRTIKDYPEYSVSDHGRIKRAGKILKTLRHTFGYPMVGLCRLGIKTKFLVHRLVAEAFLPPPDPERTQVAHNDGNPLNSHVSNLRWATYSENNRDKRLHGTQLYGSKVPNAVLHEDDVKRIRDLSARGVTGTDLADDFGVCKQTISFIINRQTWKHVA